MKRAAAIILSLTVIWLQMVVSAQTFSPASPPVACGCCTGKKACCCVEESSSSAAPIPAVPVSPSTLTDFSAILTKVVAWTLPTDSSAVRSVSNRTVSSVLAVPLFTRHCAYLI